MDHLKYGQLAGINTHYPPLPHEQYYLLNPQTRDKQRATAPALFPFPLTAPLMHKIIFEPSGTRSKLPPDTRSQLILSPSTFSPVACTSHARYTFLAT